MLFSKIKQSFQNFFFTLESKFWEIYSAIQIRLTPVKIVISKNMMSEFNMRDNDALFNFIDYCAIFDRKNVPYKIKNRIGLSGMFIYHNPKYVPIQESL